MRAANRRREDASLGRPWWEQVLRGEKNGFIAESVRRFARLGSWGYAAGVRSRELAYQKGWLSVKRLPQPTICVGNITVGGTGKTPLVIRLTLDLMARGLRPAVLLRGYKREVTREPVLVRGPDRVRAGIRESGDEAMELAARLPGSCVGVGADRYAVGQSILKQYPIDCFILDDGFQHHRLERDFNIVTLDVTDPWGGGRMLPAGLLREPPEALRRADLVVLTRSGSVGPDRLSVLRAEVAQKMRHTSALMESRHEPRELVSLWGGQKLPLTELRGKRVLAISGIGQPAGFEAALAHLGADIVGRLRLTDHGGDADIVWNWIAGNRRSVDAVIMTEKDAMRWSPPPIPGSLAGHAFALRMDLQLTGGLEHWNRLIELVQALVYAR
ncbi:MAG TPA: tetraacyldisaccharide 4'-kinase [Elusimicrobiota bacterium]|nr:tetraacyldisaccharide 4'-kinase [Elusimicrobiota bacterium]